MFKAIVVIGSLASPTPGQREDTQGLYETAPQCYYRTAQMIKDASTRIPLVFAVGVCIKVEKNNTKDRDQTPLKEKVPGSDI